MPVISNLAGNGTQVRIEISGRFSFSLHKEFRHAYRYHQNITEYRVNLARTDYIDSSALGMLLLLREHAVKANGKVVIEQPSEGVQQVLLIANFDKLFTIV